MKHYLTGLTAVLFICFSGIRASAGDTHYVATNMLSVAPYTSWENAASNIQWAVDAATAEDMVLVSNGVYDAGGMTNYPLGCVLTTRVVIAKAITVLSVNGSSVTAIKGAYSSDGHTNGTDAVRCVYMSSLGSLIGFTITNGATSTNLNSVNRIGGGIYCSSTSPIISNCVITGNSGSDLGAGAYFGAFYNTIVNNNNSPCSTLFYSLLSGCVVSNNVGGSGSGGGQNCNWYNCLITGNTGYYGAVLCNEVGHWLKNCTIVSNRGGSASSGGMYVWAYTVTVENCVIYDNQSKNVTAGGGGGFMFTNCCFTPTNSSAVLPASTNNIESDPQFVNKDAGDFRLRSYSPCVNAGTNQSWMTNSFDLDGRQRIRYGTVDMGAYEAIYEGTVYRFGF